MRPTEETFAEFPHVEVSRLLPSPVLFVVFEADRPLARGGRYSLSGVERVTIGRGTTRDASRACDGRQIDLRVPGRWLSSEHATIRAIGGEWILEDTGSRNGTFVNGVRVSTGVVRDGDVIEAGRVYFMLRGAPLAEGSPIHDLDALLSPHPYGLRTLLHDLEEQHASLVRIARMSTLPILFLGETGSGKEVLAREAHAQSGRAGPFVAVNCGALPSPLVESLLFGHVKGAFSGATHDELGFVRSAEGGTLFLDEIGDLPLPSQVALLRFLQEREVTPVGATRSEKVDVRVVAATNRPLEPGASAFRSDLLARLKGYAHRLRPLRERMEDFGIIAADVLRSLVAEGDAVPIFEPEAARAVLAYHWPLNVREVRQAMACAIALATNHVIEARHLPLEVTCPPPRASQPERGADEALRDRIVVLLHAEHGNVSAVARILGKAPAQIHRWMRRLAIDPDTYRAT